MIRRAIAHLALLTFCFSALEVVVADVHDGDANGAQVTTIEPSPDGPANNKAPDTDTSGHMHVCHCVHAHGGIVPSAQPASVEFHARVLIPRSAIAAPTVVDLDVQVRPPIG